MNKDIKNADTILAMAMDPMFVALKGGKPGRMKTLNEVKYEQLNKKFNKSELPYSSAQRK
ncbi:hypothetical protein DAPK24_052540 [Pichia kluyveri]|uniref:Uncharacterized protein n=1 Tax=Pichia kluyveri TaxID=36015 RepID=A0AAV5RDH7_PICKL|nr:hypothetical protein DAPK24_052540 [Pichia kluyveri]